MNLITVNHNKETTLHKIAPEGTIISGYLDEPVGKPGLRIYGISRKGFLRMMEYNSGNRFLEDDYPIKDLKDIIIYDIPGYTKRWLAVDQSGYFNLWYEKPIRGERTYLGTDQKTGTWESCNEDVTVIRGQSTTKHLSWEDEPIEVWVVDS